MSPEQRDACLMAAIQCNDTDAALELLAQGADPNTGDLVVVQPSSSEPAYYLWRRSRGSPEEETRLYKRTALLLLFTWQQKPAASLEIGPENPRLLKALL